MIGRIHKIPQANPLAENVALAEEINLAIGRVINSGQYIQGPEVQTFEKEFASYVGTRYGVGVASGTDAIRLGLNALGIGSGDEVITVSHTAVATIAAIEQTGAKAVVVDVNPEFYTMDPSNLLRAITRRTRAIIPVHLYGNAADLDSINQIAKAHNIDVLEDCAQAHGAYYKDRKVGSWGKLAAFSFYPTKNLGAIGDGGMVVTSDDSLVERLYQLREYGWKKRYISEITGYNSRLDELQAAILRVKLRYLDECNEVRRKLAGIYTSLLSNFIDPPKETPNARHVYHLYVIRTLQRDKLHDYLSKQGIGSGIHYPLPVHMQPAYLHLDEAPEGLPITEKLATQILSLPLYPQMETGQVEIVANCIKDYFNVWAE